MKKLFISLQDICFHLKSKNSPVLLFSAVIQNDTLITQLKDEHFDAIVHELFDFSGVG